MVTHTQNLCSAFTHPKCTQTAVNTHTEQWAAIYAAAPGEQLGVLCLAQGHLSRGIEGGKNAVHSPPPHLQYLPARESNSQPFDYESDSLPIRPRLNVSLLNKSTFCELFCIEIPQLLLFNKPFRFLFKLHC